MSEPIFSRRLLVVWIAGAVVVFAISLYFMGGGDSGGADVAGPNAYSPSAIGHEGIADVLQQLSIPVVKSRSNSLDKLSPGSVLVVAEPRRTAQVENTIGALLKAKPVLLVLPKWIAVPSDQKVGWVRAVVEGPTSDAQWALRLVAPNAEIVRERGSVEWATNQLKIAPSPDSPIQLVKGDRLRPIVGGTQGMLVGELADRDRKVWVLADPDIISNHGLSRGSRRCARRPAASCSMRRSMACWCAPPVPSCSCSAFRSWWRPRRA
jgi:hypothetical protein